MNQGHPVVEKVVPIQVPGEGQERRKKEKQNTHSKEETGKKKQKDDMEL